MVRRVDGMTSSLSTDSVGTSTNISLPQEVVVRHIGAVTEDTGKISIRNDEKREQQIPIINECNILLS